ncbi:hypothetical protein [Novosphingobium sp.]|uniref:hypothetical protein n=1 Tax=Novosphingobium sp. TaxID=1874826 RepID=UPI003565E6AA
MAANISLFSLCAAMIYLLIGGLCLNAAAIAVRSGRPGAESAWWVLCAMLFLALIALRLSGLEEHFRTLTRNLLRQDGIYEMRRDAQAPLSVLVILGTAGLVALMARLHLKTRRGSPLRFIAHARLAVAGLCGLIILRVISFHSVDGLLYGPAKLNWLIDLGSSLITGWCAYRYGRIARMPRSQR